MKSMRIGVVLLWMMGALLMAGCAGTLGSSTGYQRVRSDLIFSVKYYEGAQTLSVLLNSGTGYDYEGVPQNVYGELLGAESKDEYYNTKIKDTYKATEW